MAGAQDAQRDFAAVGDDDFIEHKDGIRDLGFGIRAWSWLPYILERSNERVDLREHLVDELGEIGREDCKTESMSDLYLRIQFGERPLAIERKRKYSGVERRAAPSARLDGTLIAARRI